MAQLRHVRARFLERQAILFRDNPRGQIVGQHIELGACHGVLGLAERGLVVSASGELLAPLLADLREEILILRFAIVGVLDLGLPIELDQQIATPDLRAGVRQMDDDELSRCRPREAGRGDWMAANRLDRAVQAYSGGCRPERLRL